MRTTVTGARTLTGEVNQLDAIDGSESAVRSRPGGSPSAVVESKLATTVVSHGDSLWRISRATYGAGCDTLTFTKQTGTNPKSKSDLSRPDLCPSYESTLKSGGNSNALARDGCAPFLLALGLHAIPMRRRRRPSDAEQKTRAALKWVIRRIQQRALPIRQLSRTTNRFDAPPPKRKSGDLRRKVVKAHSPSATDH